MLVRLMLFLNDRVLHLRQFSISLALVFISLKSIHLLKCVWEAHDLHCYGQSRMAVQIFFASFPWASS